jgi:hypothetical protein
MAMPPGGRYLLTASAEYVRQGVRRRAFYDIADAAGSARRCPAT